MLSTLTKSIRRKFQPEETSPVLSHKTVTLPRNEEHQTPKRSLYYRDSHSHRRGPPQDADHDDSDESDEGDMDGEEREEDAHSSDNGAEEESPLLPIFSSVHLDALPIYNLTHIFRELIIERCDTVLTWEQLRSPQVSQFLVKPIQIEIKQNHMSAGTHYALLANSLQFMKEVGTHAGNSGTNKTRAMLCELIAIKLLRECNTRALIDALSYDFDPLQGQPAPGASGDAPQSHRSVQRAARISCIEIAIRANAKRFLAHPLVVKQLEAIWNGSIVFYAAADNMHRTRQPLFFNSYGTTGQPSLQALRTASSSKWSVMLYNPRDASLFKLSRLRVPRYRNILSTISFAILLMLFLFVNQKRSLEVSTLELVFWVWAAGYMLDEVIGFNDQGFSLYIASFWNTFDLGILLLLLVHLVLRLYGFMVLDPHEKIHIASRAYDVLAATAVLLFPRLFSVLDHYRYFSQLIIAFRMMAADMIAIFVLILIFCSGFLVALTFAFSNGDLRDNPKDVAYALLQMLLGFTPAAWDRWGDYNWLGRTILILFLFVCHFVVVTILITVMTNSFMEIVRNANEEHQYLFAVNVISSVKSDALFAYVPPSNVLQWLLTPLRFVLPFRQYVKVNRTIIKVTHFPILWTIYLYERLVLQARYVDTTDLIESKGRVNRTISQRLPRLGREPSIATFRQDAALAEVFRQPTDTVMRTARSTDRRKASNVVNSWINNSDDAEPPQEQDRKVVDKLERRRFGTRRMPRPNLRDVSSSRRPMSVLSDPIDFTSFADFLSPLERGSPSVGMKPTHLDLPSQETDMGADGDDELLTNDIDDNETNVEPLRPRVKLYNPNERSSLRKDYFTRKMSSQVPSQDGFDHSDSTRHPQGLAGSQSHSKPGIRPQHARNPSSATMIYNPSGMADQAGPTAESTVLDVPHEPLTEAVGQPVTPPSKSAANLLNRKTPKRVPDKPRARPGLPSKDNQAFRSTPDVGTIFGRPRASQAINAPPGKPVRRSSLEMDLVSDIGDNKAIGGGYVGALPASFASQMNHMQRALRQSQMEIRKAEEKRRMEESEMFGRLMMARMNTLEEGFREVVHEVREGMKQVGSGLASRQRSPEREVHVVKRHRKFKERQERNPVGSGGSAVGSVIGVGDRPESAGGSGKERENWTKSPLAHGGPVKEPESPKAEETELGQADSQTLESKAEGSG